MFRFFVLAFFLVLYAPQNVNAQSDKTSGFFSASYLYALCNSDENGREIVKGGHTACQSYIAGVIDYHKLTQTLGLAPTVNFCVPNTDSMRKLQNIVLAYLKKNTQHAQFVAAPVVAFALFDAYPCKKRRRDKS